MNSRIIIRGYRAAEIYPDSRIRVHQEVFAETAKVSTVMWPFIYIYIRVCMNGLSIIYTYSICRDRFAYGTGYY